jgi:glycosyltransferase involved in cell wall biosynthesis
LLRTLARAGQTQWLDCAALAAELLEDPADVVVVLHSGTVLLPHRLQHDELLLRIHPGAGILTLPLLRRGKGCLQQVPSGLLAAARPGVQPARLPARQLLDGSGGLSGSPWLLDCLSLRADALRACLQPGDASILPALQAWLSDNAELLVAERCLTSCSSSEAEPGPTLSVSSPVVRTGASAEPLISVIVPCWNVERYLVDCLESIKAQTFARYELICVDDASTDATPQILKMYLDRFPGAMKVITHRQNLGLGAARNSGIAQAQGDYLASVDSDDWIDAWMLESLYNGAIEFDAEITTVGIKDVSPRGAILGRQTYARSCHSISSSDNFFALCMPSFCNKLWKRSLFSDTGISFPPGIYFEDLATTPRLLSRSSRLAFVEGAPYNYRTRSGSIIQSVSLKHLLGYITAFDILKDFFASKLTSSSCFRSYFLSMVQDHLVYFLGCAGVSSAARSPLARTVAALGIGYIESLQKEYGGVDGDPCSRLSVYLAVR